LGALENLAGLPSRRPAAVGARRLRRAQSSRSCWAVGDANAARREARPCTISRALERFRVRGRGREGL